ncbi:uncharacterized protein LOC143258705 isoform X6 [Tachypleus tridentatus]|uniref:uncharacterized protein LOC143258705 isoform X6 n=1 Tax=Tachypleus tridentatus TaxID=6853 RepID=UPI003FD512A4
MYLSSIDIFRIPLSRLRRRQVDLTCGICGKEHSLNLTYKNNQEENLPQHRCGVCHKTFRTYCTMRSHFHHQHKSHRNFPCFVCGKIFTRKHSMETHFNSKHHSDNFM